MATTRYPLTPNAAEFPTANFAPRTKDANSRTVLSFDPTTSQSCWWTLVAWQGLTTPLTLIIHYTMVSAVSGSVYFRAYVEAVTAGDALNIDTTDSFDVANAANAVVPATAGYEQEISITLTSNDAIAAGDLIRIKLDRDAANAGDTAASAAYVHAVELRDNA